MKFLLLRAIPLLAALAGFRLPARAADDAPLAYAPAVVTLTGTIFEESYGDDPPSPRYRHYHAWILRLDRPISIRGVPGDEINTDATNVREIDLNVDHDKHPISKRAFRKTCFVATGTLYQPGTSYFRRPVALSVATLQPAGTGHRRQQD